MELKAPHGLIGLSNLGNTCYMNSALQCLSNLDIFKNYFLQMKYKNEINLQNPLGSKGEVVNTFSNLLYKMWNKAS